MIDYWLNHYDHLLTALYEHVKLTVLSLSISIVLSLPLGLFISKFKRLSAPVLAILGIIYTIPSLGFFAMLVHYGAGLGTQSAVIALVSYSQLILVRNVMVGFQSVDPAIVEAGRGMGYNAMQLFRKIELPLALPTMLGGVRIASVSVISLATIAASINAGGLGVILFEGLNQNSVPKMVWGSLLVALLSIGTNQLLLYAEKKASKRALGLRAE